MTFIEQPKQKVRRPSLGAPGCWVALRVPSTNRSFAKTYVGCSKKVRAEKLTCAQHDRWEQEAQELKELEDQRKRGTR